MLFLPSSVQIHCVNIPAILANSPPFDPNKPAHHHPSSGTLWLIGGILAVVALVLVAITVGVVLLIIYLAKRRRAKKQQTQLEGASSETHPNSVSPTPAPEEIDQQKTTP